MPDRPLSAAAVVCTPCTLCNFLYVTIDSGHFQSSASLTIEEVWVIWCWHAVELPYIEKVIVLPVHITTHCEVAVLWYVDVY